MNHDVVCCLSPAGASAVAVVGLRGPTVWSKVSPCFTPAKTMPMLSPLPQLSLGKLERDGLGDEIILVLQGEENWQVIELQLHGGPGIVQWCLQFAQDLGCSLIDWPDWYQSELWKQLPLATTTRTAGMLLDQCMGAMDRQLLSITTRIQQNETDRSGLLAEVEQLLAFESLGAHLVHPWKIVLAGPPNAGKSSLLNALVGYQRAITSPVPGTTRDLVTATVAWNGYPMEFVDTAGLHDASDTLEIAGMGLTQQATRVADLVLWLVDLSEDHEVRPVAAKSILLVGTKGDLPRRQSCTVDTIVSAMTGSGLKELLSRIGVRLIPRDPAPGQAIPLLPSQMEELSRLHKILRANA